MRLTRVRLRSRSLSPTQAAAGADIVMLDNYSPAALAEDARKVKEKFPHVLVEASGVSYSSSGAVTV